VTTSTFLPKSEYPDMIQSRRLSVQVSIRGASCFPRDILQNVRAFTTESYMDTGTHKDDCCLVAQVVDDLGPFLRQSGVLVSEIYPY